MTRKKLQSGKPSTREKKKEEIAKKSIVKRPAAPANLVLTHLGIALEIKLAANPGASWYAGVDKPPGGGDASKAWRWRLGSQTGRAPSEVEAAHGRALAKARSTAPRQAAVVR